MKETLAHEKLLPCNGEKFDSYMEYNAMLCILLHFIVLWSDGVGLKGLGRQQFRVM
jgi:hypothetical protein